MYITYLVSIHKAGFAQDAAFAQEAYDAGMRIAYLQFDGVGNENNEHRKIGNLFDIKLKAIENLYNAGIDVVLVVTLVNTVNDHQVGSIFDFAVANSDKITFVSFQPVSFTGRDEDISNEDRMKMRYTLADMAHDLKKQTGLTEPLRDWFPLSAISVFSDFTDLIGCPSGNILLTVCMTGHATLAVRDSVFSRSLPIISSILITNHLRFFNLKCAIFQVSLFR